jgi:hypothetical protein
VPQKPHSEYDRPCEISVAPQLPLRNSVCGILLIYDDLQPISQDGVYAVIAVEPAAAPAACVDFVSEEN